MAQALAENEKVTSVINLSSLPSLKDAEENPISITPTYLEVEDLEKGWKKMFFFGGFVERDVPLKNDDGSVKCDEKTGEVMTKRLKSVLMIVEGEEDGTYDTLESAAAMVVSTLEERVKAGLATINKSGFSITYLGKKKTKSGNFCANFSLKTLNLGS